MLMCTFGIRTIDDRGEKSMLPCVQNQVSAGRERPAMGPLTPTAQERLPAANCVLHSGKGSRL